MAPVARSQVWGDDWGGVLQDGEVFIDREGGLFHWILAMREWTDCNFTHLCRHGRTEEHDNIECEVFDKMIVSYITGKARILQRWVRSFEELPMVCPCAEEV